MEASDTRRRDMGTVAAIGEHEEPKSRTVFGIASLFTISYFVIHLVINIYFNPNPEPLIVNLYGPISISLCTGLLIYSFGTFLQRTISKISVCYPQGYSDQFVIFVIALTIIQFTGHAEIVVNDPSQWASVVTNYPLLAWVIKALSIIGFPLMVISLMLLEKHQSRIIDAMQNELAVSSDEHSLVKITGIFTFLTLILTFLVKLVTTTEFIPAGTGEESVLSKARIYVVAIALEAIFTLYVVFKHEFGSLRWPKRPERPSRLRKRLTSMRIFKPQGDVSP